MSSHTSYCRNKCKLAEIGENVEIVQREVAVS